MKQIIKYCLVLLLPLFFTACAGGALGQPSVAKNQELPSWYLNTPPSNNNFYHGVGSGATKEEAKINALNNIASVISVSISSNMEISKKTTTSSYEKEVESNTKASVDKIKFTGVSIIENAQQDGKIYTYLKVNRAVLFDAQKTKVDNDYNKLLGTWKNIQKEGVFSLIQNSDQLNKDIVEVSANLPILKAINNSFDNTKYDNTLLDIKNKATDLKSNALVYVNFKNDVKPYAEIVKQYISSIDLNIVETANVKNRNNLLIIDVSMVSKSKKVKTSDPRLRGASFADVTITLKTLNSNHKVLAQNLIKVLNISKEGYKDAVNKTQKFEREIKQQGILNILLKKTSK